MIPPRLLPYPELVEGIVKDPDNDDLRLSYARRLATEGNVLGRFIEWSVNAARSGDAERADFDTTEPIDERDFLPDDLHAAVNCPAFKRGFVEETGLYARELEGHVHELFRALPLLRRITVYAQQYGRDPDASLRSLLALFRVEQFARIEKLWLPSDWKGQGDSLARALADLASARGLRELDLSSSDISRVGITALLTSQHLTRLNSLRITFSALDRDALVAIADHGERLESLWLWKNGLNSRAIEPLCASMCLARLKMLRLSQNEIGAAGGLAIANAATLPVLEFLEVDDQTPETVVHLATTRRLPRLRILLVSGRKLGRKLGSALGRATPTHALDELNLYGALMGDKGVADFCNSSFLIAAEVTRLNLGGNEITDRGAAELARAPSLRRLKSLDLSHNKITEKGQDVLRASDILAHTKLDFGFRPT